MAQRSRESGVTRYRAPFRELTREGEKAQPRYRERSYGSFTRSFSLPAAADAEKLRAAFQDGVLRVHIPKREETKPRTIEIQP